DSYDTNWDQVGPPESYGGPEGSVNLAAPSGRPGRGGPCWAFRVFRVVFSLRTPPRDRAGRAPDRPEMRRRPRRFCPVTGATGRAGKARARTPNARLPCGK